MVLCSIGVGADPAVPQPCVQRRAGADAPDSGHVLGALERSRGHTIVPQESATARLHAVRVHLGEHFGGELLAARLVETGIIGVGITVPVGIDIRVAVATATGRWARADELGITRTPEIADDPKFVEIHLDRAGSVGERHRPAEPGRAIANTRFHGRGVGDPLGDAQRRLARFETIDPLVGVRPAGTEAVRRESRVGDGERQTGFWNIERDEELATSTGFANGEAHSGDASVLFRVDVELVLNGGHDGFFGKIDIRHGVAQNPGGKGELVTSPGLDIAIGIPIAVHVDIAIAVNIAVDISVNIAIAVRFTATARPHEHQPPPRHRRSEKQRPRAPGHVRLLITFRVYPSTLKRANWLEE